MHVGDYVAPQTLLTTIDENAELEAYIYIPTERAADIRMGLPVQIVTSTGEPIESTKVDFISQQVDNSLQGILVKAPIHASFDKFRTAQLVKARVVWSTSPTPTVPVLAVTRIGGQSFVFVVALEAAYTVVRDVRINQCSVLGPGRLAKQTLESGTS